MLQAFVHEMEFNAQIKFLATAAPHTMHVPNPGFFKIKILNCAMHPILKEKNKTFIQKNKMHA